MTQARISLIAAVAENGVIGHLGKMPWHVPSDLALFKKYTLGKPVLMGRKTYDSIGGPLHRRYNIIVSRKRKKIPGSIVCQSLNAALSRGLEIASRQKAGELMIVGGGEIYAATLPFAHRLYITRIKGAFEGDAYFPAFSSANWDMAQHFPEQQGARDTTSYQLEIWRRAGVPEALPSRHKFEIAPVKPDDGDYLPGL